MANSGGTTRKRATQKIERSPAEWRITGVTKKTREAVARAARKDKISIGKWVDRTLREAAEMRLKGGPPGLVLPPELLDTLHDISRNVEQLNERRSFGAQTLQQVQDVATELGEQVSSAYESLAKRADPAIDEVRSRTKETLEDAARWRAGLTDKLRNAAGGIERLQQLVMGHESSTGKRANIKQNQGSTARNRQLKRGGASASSTTRPRRRQSKQP